MASEHNISDEEFSFKDLGSAPQPAPSPPVPSPAPAPPAASQTPLERPVPVPGRQAPRERAAGDPDLDSNPGLREALSQKPQPAPPPVDSHARQRTDPRHLVQSWLGDMVANEASDLILRSGGRPSLRVDGRIKFLPGEVPGPGPMLQVMEGILGPERLMRWKQEGAADAAIQLDGLGRFRINAYKQMGEPAIVIRRINEQAPTLDDLNLPASELKDLAMRKRGLVLVTGVAGSGKSTTLAGMIEFMNRSVERHVVTLEDPVELLFKERYCVISQREVGTDTQSFKDGLKHALRQSPDVILIGEVRDAETVVAALEAVETGHLVMSTMHTVNASQTVDRILGYFPAERHEQIRQRMAQNLAGVLSMRLVPRVGGGMVPAFELLQSTPQVRELLEEGRTTELGRVVASGTEPGVISFNERLVQLINDGLVSVEDALATSDRPDELLLTLRGIRGGTDRGKGQGGGEAPSAGPEGQQRRRSDPGGPAQPSREDPRPASQRVERRDGPNHGLRLRGNDPAA